MHAACTLVFVAALMTRALCEVLEVLGSVCLADGARATSQVGANGALTIKYDDGSAEF